jgi:20S proteasome alpha/beta subunit
LPTPPPLSLSFCAQTTAGLTADGKHLANRARDEALNFRDTFRMPTPVPVSVLVSLL